MPHRRHIIMYGMECCWRVCAMAMAVVFGCGVVFRRRTYIVERRRIYGERGAASQSHTAAEPVDVRSSHELHLSTSNFWSLFCWCASRHTTQLLRGVCMHMCTRVCKQNRVNEWVCVRVCAFVSISTPPTTPSLCLLYTVSVTPVLRPFWLCVISITHSASDVERMSASDTYHHRCSHTPFLGAFFLWSSECHRKLASNLILVSPVRVWPNAPNVVLKVCPMSGWTAHCLDDKWPLQNVCVCGVSPSVTYVCRPSPNRKVHTFTQIPSKPEWEWGKTTINSSGYVVVVDIHV